MTWLYQSEKRGFRERPKRSHHTDSEGLIVSPFRIPHSWFKGMSHGQVEESMLAIDIETNAKPWWSGECRIQTIGLCDEQGAQAYDMCVEQDRLDCFLRIRSADGWIFHNATFDLPILVMAGYLLPCAAVTIHDTIQMARVANNLEPKVGLDDLGRKYLKMGKIETPKKCWLLPKPELLEYNKRDAEITWLLYHRYLMRKDLQDWWPIYSEQEMPLTWSVIAMHQEGLPLDYEWCIAFFAQIGGDIKKLNKLYPEGLNHNSGPQVSRWLFGDVLKSTFNDDGGTWIRTDKKGILKPRPEHPLCKPTKACPHGFFSTSEDELLLYPKGEVNEGIELLLASRGLEKNFGYVKGLVEAARWNGRVHATFMPYRAQTGRWSCARPNLQQIPGEPYIVRLAFLTEDGYELWSYDYDQMELRLMGSESGETKWIECINAGGDPHEVNAKALGITRDHAKRVIYCWMFGGGAKTMAQTIRMPVSYGEKIVRGFRKGLPKASRYMNDRKKLSKKEGKFFTPYGRKLRVKADYQATDYTIQGGCADLLKQRCIVLTNWLWEQGLKTRLVLTIHDEIVVKIWKPEKRLVVPMIKKILEDHDTFTLPLTVGKGLFYEKY